MLSKKPQGRWPDLNAFLDALELRVPRSSNPAWTEMAEATRPVATVEVQEPADPLHPGFGGGEEWWVYGQDEWEEELGRTVNLVPRRELIPIGSTATVVFSMTVPTNEEDQLLDEEVFPLTMRFQRDQGGWALRELW